MYSIDRIKYGDFFFCTKNHHHSNDSYDINGIKYIEEEKRDRRKTGGTEKT